MKKYLLAFGMIFCFNNSFAVDLPSYPSNDGLQKAIEKALGSVKQYAAISDAKAKMLGFKSIEEASKAELGLKARIWILGCRGIRDYRAGADWEPIVLSRTGIIQSITNAAGEIRAQITMVFYDGAWKLESMSADNSTFRNIKLLTKKSGKILDLDTMGFVYAPAMGGTEFVGYYDDTKYEWIFSALFGWSELEFEFGKTLPAPEWIQILSKYASRFCPQ